MKVKILPSNLSSVEPVLSCGVALATSGLSTFGHSPPVRGLSASTSVTLQFLARQSWFVVWLNHARVFFAVAKRDFQEICRYTSTFCTCLVAFPSSKRSQVVLKRFILYGWILWLSRSLCPALAFCFCFCSIRCNIQ